MGAMTELKKVWAIVDYNDCHGGYPSRMSFHLEEPVVTKQSDWPVHFAVYEGVADNGEFAVIVRQDISTDEVIEQLVEEELGEDWHAYEDDFNASRLIMATGQGVFPGDVVTLLLTAIRNAEEDLGLGDLEFHEAYLAFVRVMLRLLHEHREVLREMAQEEVEVEPEEEDEEDPDHGQIILEDEGTSI
jgi:hypothetical protein